MAQNAIKCYTDSNPVPADVIRQKSWDLLRAEQIFKDLYQKPDLQGKCRLRASSQKIAGAWLNAIPNASLGFKLNDTQLRVAVSLCLAAPMCQPHRCSGCVTPVNELGTHGLSCRKSTGQFS